MKFVVSIFFDIDPSKCFHVPLFCCNCSLSVVLQSGKFGKLNKTIKFPEILNLAPYMSGTSDKSPVYQLYGVVVHLDVMNAAFSGHYVCYVRNFQNRWFKVDDSSVCHTNELMFYLFPFIF